MVVQMTLNFYSAKIKTKSWFVHSTQYTVLDDTDMTNMGVQNKSKTWDIKCVCADEINSGFLCDAGDVSACSG